LVFVGRSGTHDPLSKNQFRFKLVRGPGQILFQTHALARGLGSRHGGHRPSSLPFVYSLGRRVCQSVARSYIRATRSSFSSSNGAAKICKPIGSPVFVNPHGMLTPGMPARLALIV